MLPKEIANLQVAGRCAGTTHEALGSLRVMPQCGVMGEAAGTAAAIAIRDGKSPAEIAVPKLQEELRRLDCIVAAADIPGNN